MPRKPHNHRCRECDTVWHHDPSTIPDSKASYEAAHACPECGIVEYFVDKADNGTPQYCSNGTRCILLDGSGALRTPVTAVPNSDLGYPPGTPPELVDDYLAARDIGMLDLLAALLQNEE